MAVSARCAPDDPAVAPAGYRGGVLCTGFLLTLVESLGEDEFVDALSLLYCRDNRRGRAGGDLDLYALFAEIDWPEGYYYCMHHEPEVRLLHRDLLRLPRNGRRYKEGRWRSRGYTPRKLDAQARIAREILNRG